MKRIITTAAVVAVAALGVGVTVGSLGGSSAAPPPTTTSSSQTAQTWDQRMCEQAAQQLRARHPDAYIGGCNHGSGTVPTP